MCTNISSTRLSRSLAGLSKPFYYIYTHVSEDPITPCLPKQTRFGLFPVRSPLLRESLLFSLPMGTKMFQFPTFALSLRKCRSSSPAGCPIRKSADRVVCANPRSLSQLITSFFAPESLGIHRLPSLYFFARIYILLHISSPLLHIEYTVIEFLSEVTLRLHFNALLSFLFYLTCHSVASPRLREAATIGWRSTLCCFFVSSIMSKIASHIVTSSEITG